MLLFVGCKPTPSDDEPTPTPTPNGETLKEFVATISNPVSRAIVESNTRSQWSLNDALTVVRFDSPTTRPQLVQCTVKGESIDGNSATFTKAGYINEEGEQYAVYPQTTASTSSFTAGNATNGRMFYLSLPEQSTDGSGNIIYPLLIGNYDSSTKSFNMVNPLTLLQITVKAPASESYQHTILEEWRHSSLFRATTLRRCGATYHSLPPTL